VKLVVPLILFVVLVGGAAGAPPRAAAPAPYAGTCGIPAAQPVWFEFGQPYLQPVFGKPNVVVGTSTGDWPAQMRALGAGTVYFDLNLKNRVGTPTNPTATSTMADRAQKLYTFAAQQTGCSTPVVVFNELSGPGLVTPWSDTNAQYRANVLSLIQHIAQLGAHPVLLIPAPAYTGGDALTWWQQVSAVAEIVREVYVPASATWKNGPVLGNRTLRNSYRNAVTNLMSIGMTANKVGLMVSFSTTRGFGGRNGLEPVSAWFQVAKWQSLALQQVAAETGIASVWSWGWGRWSVGEQDPEKGHAACVWLWARSPSLCDAPTQLGPGFDTSLKEGQLSLLPAGAQCLIGKRRLSNAAIAQLQLLTGDRETAYSALFERLVESDQTPVPTAAVLEAERGVILQSFGGSRGAYESALREANASVPVARGILGDQLRRTRVQATLPGGTPTRERDPDLLPVVSGSFRSHDLVDAAAVVARHEGEGARDPPRSRPTGSSRSSSAARQRCARARARSASSRSTIRCCSAQYRCARRRPRSPPRSADSSAATSSRTGPSRSSATSRTRPSAPATTCRSRARWISRRTCRSCGSARRKRCLAPG